jgi:hypothetical protein
MTEQVHEYDAIARVVQLYIVGGSKGDVGKLKEAFHDDARMFGDISGTRYDVPISAFFDMAAATPADADGRYEARIVSVNQVGDAATATVVEEGCWGNVSFVDYFCLARIGGAWKIVSKVFAHTGGEMPAS